jgi:hypothetical protein
VCYTSGTLKRPFLVGVVLVAGALAACSSGQNKAFEEAPESVDAGIVAPEDPTDFSFVYARYLGPGTPGHCGNEGCHAEKQKTFACGDSKDSCYEGLVRAGLVDTSNPIASKLGDPKSSPLAWFGEGLMPKDDPSPNVEGARAITRWLEAGAKNRGYSTSYKTPIEAGADARREEASLADASQPSDGGRRDVNLGDANVPAPTWTYLYSYYFGPATPGHCGNCHHSTYPGFRCGASKYDCYQGMIDAGLIDTSNPTKSPIGDPSLSPLSWLGGSEPRDTPSANPTAAGLVRAWVAAGAPFN